MNDAGPMNVVGGDRQAETLSPGNDQDGSRSRVLRSHEWDTGRGNLLAPIRQVIDCRRQRLDGVLVYGSSANTIGGATSSPGTGLGNVIAGNSRAGIQIYNPG